jgi:ABC-type bacteriocin/lantibiotic exporter with double-glycine peptidase domain
MKKLIIQIIKLFNNNTKIALLLIFFVINSIFDFISIGIVGPLIAIQTNSINLDSSRFILYFSNFIKFYPLATYSAILLIFIFKYILSILILNLSYKYALDNKANLQTLFLGYFLKMPYEKYLKVSNSEKLYTIQSIIPDYSNTLVIFLKLFSDLFLIIAVFLLLAYSNFYLLISSIIFFIIIFFLYDRFIKIKLHDYSNNNIDSGTQLIQSLNQTLDGKKEINIFGVKKYFLHYFRRHAENNAYVVRKILIIGLLPKYIFEFIFVFSVLLIFTWLRLKNINPILYLSTITTFTFAAFRLLPSLNSIISGYSQMRYFQKSIDILYQNFLEIEEFKILDKEEVTLRNDFQKISLIDVSFKYSNTDNYILKRINLEIEKGDRICILGGSGSGKTTLIDIISQFLEPTEGNILYNSNPISITNNYKENIAYIPQNFILLKDTIKKNIAIGIEDNLIDINLIIDSIDKANLSDLIISKKNGINEPLSDNGSNISGGQKQRIALARAFYFNRDFIILDEPTSALDMRTEKEIFRNLFLNEKNKNVTFLIITHRPEVLQYCNKIYDMKNGNLNIYKSE